MTLSNYLSTTVYRYYIKKFIIVAQQAFSRRSAIFIEVDFRNPKTLTEVDMRNPKTLSSVDLRNPKTLTEADMQIRTVS